MERKKVEENVKRIKYRALHVRHQRVAAVNIGVPERHYTRPYKVRGQIPKRQEIKCHVQPHCDPVRKKYGVKRNYCKGGKKQKI
jgi:hypothetical protein